MGNTATLYTGTEEQGATVDIVAVKAMVKHEDGTIAEAWVNAPGLDAPKGNVGDE